MTMHNAAIPVAEHAEKRYTVEVHNGFRVLERVDRLDVEQAARILRGRGQRRYTSARRVGQEAVLTRYEILCPACGKRAPAHRGTGELGPEDDWKKLPRDALDRWAAPQAVPIREVLLFRKRPERRSYSCEFCGHFSGAADHADTVEVCSVGRKILLTCGRTEMSNLFSFADLTEEILPLPISEEVEFNFETGKAFLRLVGRGGKHVGEMDLTAGMRGFAGSALYELLKTSRPLRRKLLRTFSEQWGAPVPFRPEEAAPESFVALTMFQGYDDRAFYDAIPFSVRSAALDGSFREMADRLRRAEDLPRLYRESALPQTKACRRLFFTNPGLLFFLREAEFLWQCTGDVNVFRNHIMGLPNLYAVLSLLHRCPGAKAFFAGYAAEKGPLGLASAIRQRWTEDVRPIALQYAATDEYGRAEMRQCWKPVGLLGWSDEPYTLPMRPGVGSIRDCRVDGFDFVWLRTRADYRTAGRRLKNCLTEWSAWGNPVIVIKERGEYRGAIEMDGEEVVQVHAERNRSIMQDPRLHAAFNSWLQKYQLKKPAVLAIEEMGELLF